MRYYLVEYLPSGAVALRSGKVIAIQVGFYAAEFLATEGVKVILGDARLITPVFFECNGQYWTLYNHAEINNLSLEIKQNISVSIPVLDAARSDDILEEFFDEIK